MLMEVESESSVEALLESRLEVPEKISLADLVAALKGAAGGVHSVAC